MSRTPWWAIPGGACAIVGLGLCAAGGWWIGGGLVALGAPVMAANMWWFAIHPIRLSATEDGIRFGGGELVPWSEIRSIQIQPHGGHRVLAIRFHDRARSMARLPWWSRLRRAPAGDVALGARVFEDELDQIASALTAIRSGSRPGARWPRP